MAASIAARTRLDALAVERAALAGHVAAGRDDVGRAAAVDRADVRGRVLVEPCRARIAAIASRGHRDRGDALLGRDARVARAAVELGA